MRSDSVQVRHKDSDREVEPPQATDRVVGLLVGRVASG